MDRKENRKSIVTSGYFYTLAGKTKLKVFEGEFEGDSPRGGEMSAKLTKGTDPIRVTFFKKFSPQ